MNSSKIWKKTVEAEKSSTWPAVTGLKIIIFGRPRIGRSRWCACVYVGLGLGAERKESFERDDADEAKGEERSTDLCACVWEKGEERSTDLSVCVWENGEGREERRRIEKD